MHEAHDTHRPVNEQPIIFVLVDLVNEELQRQLVEHGGERAHPDINGR